VNVALRHLKNKGVETTLIHLTDYDVKPCRNCNMECYYDKECPTPDDSKKLANFLEEFDGLIVGAPLYNGTIPALLSAFLERNPFPYNEILKDKVTSAIIIGSLGETLAALILMSWLAPGKNFVDWIELDPRATAARNAEFKDSWLKGNLMDNEQNQIKVTGLADKVYAKMLERKKLI
jgi:multimeric flavodoxin WrbA